MRLLRSILLLSVILGTVNVACRSGEAASTPGYWPE